MWRPLESFLYDGRRSATAGTLLDRLAAMPVRIAHVPQARHTNRGTLVLPQVARRHSQVKVKTR